MAKQCTYKWHFLIVNVIVKCGLKYGMIIIHHVLFVNKKRNITFFVIYELVRGGSRMGINPTKQKVIDTASVLFFQKGFHATSVRDIADQAAVNVSLISYYFNGKQGLLEYAVTNYYEAYLTTIEETLQTTESLSTIEQLKRLIHTIVAFKTNHYKLTALIHRELSLDSTFVREVTVTYLAKENHYIKKLFQSMIHPTKKQHADYLFMQLKGMMTSPFSLKSEWNDLQIIDEHTEKLFIQQYTTLIFDWLQFIAHEQ